MKHIILIGLLLVSIHCWGQVPQGIQFQAIARDAFGTPLPSSNLTVRFGLKDTANALIYQETHAVITDQFGLFEAVIGEGTSVSGTFSDVRWKEGQHSVDIDIDSGSGFVNIGNTPLQSVPFGFYATYADSATFAENGKIKVNGDEELHWLKANGDTMISAKSNGSNGAGQLMVKGANGHQNASIGALSSLNLNLGYLQLNDTNGIPKASLWVDPDNRGNLTLLGAGGFESVSLGDVGRLKINATNGDNNITLTAFDWGAGEFFGRNGSVNVLIDRTPGLSGSLMDNHGFIAVCDSNSNQRAQMYVDANGTGVISAGGVVFLEVDGKGDGVINLFDSNGNRRADLSTNGSGSGQLVIYGANNMPVSTINGGMKNFIMPHPSKPEKNIVYACIEGPEAAAYERGTTQLINGEAFISFSGHFEIVVNPNTLTISTSPWSAASKGLAVVERSETGFKVKELFNGKGNYKFDWEAKGVRKGYEDFKAIQERN